MKRILLVCFFVSVFLSSVFAQSNEINIVPKPSRIDKRDGAFTINDKTSIVATDPAGKKNANLLVKALESVLGLRLKVTHQRQASNEIIFQSVNLELENDLYLLNIEPNFIRISGEERSQFYAMQSLIQLLSTRNDGTASVPAARIVDAPRFAYRGMHLDVARHFQSVDFVKRYIDLMSQFKFNYFHWHLTDDQGWRIEIKKYPKLTEIGSKRPESHEGVYSPTFKGDGRPVEGFYTQEQIKDVVRYAKERYITVVPEIELPGHASAALAAYPELGTGCAKPDYKFEVKKTWGIFKEVFCPTDQTFKFLEDVLDETIRLFPDSPYIHIGGDEVLKDFWKESAFVQDLMKRENLKDEHAVQSYFVQRMEKYVNSKGKKIIGWDEILEGGLAPNATVMSWRGMKGGIEAAKARHDVIMTPTDYSYFDYGQGDPATEPLSIGGYVPLEKVYAFEPVPAELSADEAKHIIGGQANIWTEYLETPPAVEYMAFPRMLALSEVLWSRKEDRNFGDFHRRMLTVLPRLDSQGVNYRIPEPIAVGAFLLGENEAKTVDIKTPIPGGKVLFTIDGTTPNERSPEAPPRFVANPEGENVLQLKTIVVLPNGRKSSVYSAVFLRRKMKEADQTTAATPGLNYTLYVPDENPKREDRRVRGETQSLLLTQFEKTIDLQKPFAADFVGYLRIATDGVYELQVDSTWDVTLRLGGNELINDAGTADRKMRSVIVPLKAGLHKFGARYSHRGGTPHFRIRQGIKGRGLSQLGGGSFVH